MAMGFVGGSVDNETLLNQEKKKRKDSLKRVKDIAEDFYKDPALKLELILEYVNSELRRGDIYETGERT